MKKYIFIFSTALLAVICFSAYEELAAEAPWHSDFTLVDFSAETDKALKALGFALPATRIKAPDISLEDLEGKVRSLSSFRGKIVLLNFWGVWCGYCRREMPSLQRLYSRMKPLGLEIAAVDVRDTPEEVREYIAKNKYTFPVLLDKNLTATETYGISAFPTTFIVDAEGFLRAMFTGAIEWDKPNVIALFDKILEKRQGTRTEPPTL